MRNLAYRLGAEDAPAGWSEAWAEKTGGQLVLPEANFCIIVFNNALEMCVLEFCKLFVERDGNHYWRSVLSDPDSFIAELLHTLNMTEAQYLAHNETFKTYRDKFLAHLDDERVMHIPELDVAKTAVHLLHSWIVEREVDRSILGRLVASADHMARAYEEERAMAARIYRKIVERSD